MTPRLETARLTLAPHTVADFEPLAEMWGDPEVVRFIGPASSRRESWMRLLRFGGLWPLLGYGYWAVRETATGRYVGDVGFGDFHREIEPSIDGVPEAGWVLASWTRGRRYGSEAVSAALAWLDAQPAWGRSVCVIDPDNAASLRTASRHGFGALRTVRFNGNDMALLTRIRPPA